MKKLFEDQADGGFFSTVEGDENLVMRMKEDYDGAEPSGNSVAILALLRLGDEPAAERALRTFSSKLQTQGTSAPQMVIALTALQQKAQQVVIAGDRKSAQLLIDAAHSKFSPFRVLLLNPADHPEFTTVEDQAAAWVCKDFTCQLPVTTVRELNQLLT